MQLSKRWYRVSEWLIRQLLKMTSSGLKDDAATQPNFRSAYYEKVGFRGVDERKALQAILGQNPINIEKLATFILKCSNLAEASRLFVWKLLLGKAFSLCVQYKHHIT